MVKHISYVMGGREAHEIRENFLKFYGNKILTSHSGVGVSQLVATLYNFILALYIHICLFVAAKAHDAIEDFCHLLGRFFHAVFQPAHFKVEKLADKHFI